MADRDPVDTAELLQRLEVIFLAAGQLDEKWRLEVFDRVLDALLELESRRRADPSGRSGRRIDQEQRIRTAYEKLQECDPGNPEHVATLARRFQLSAKTVYRALDLSQDDDKAIE